METFDQFVDNLNESFSVPKDLEYIAKKHKKAIHRLSILEYDNYIDFFLIRIKEDFKGQGILKEIMLSTIEYANKKKLPIVINPSEQYGTEKSNLESIYRKFGFEYQSGNCFDAYMDAMVKYPD